MNKDIDVVDAVVNEHFNRMLEQERKVLKPLIITGSLQGCPFLDKDQIFEITLRMAVMMKISIIARLN